MKRLLRKDFFCFCFSDFAFVEAAGIGALVSFFCSVTLVSVSDFLISSFTVSLLLDTTEVAGC